MHYRRSDAMPFAMAGGTSGVLYPPHPRGEQSVAEVILDGVYPEKGYSINDRCTETLFLLEGEFELEYSGQKTILRPGDLFMILPHHAYRITGRGRAHVFITPAWDSEQNHIVE